MILAGVTALTLLAWYYTAHLMAGMAPMGDMHRPMAMPQMPPLISLAMTPPVSPRRPTAKTRMETRMKTRMRFVRQ